MKKIEILSYFRERDGFLEEKNERNLSFKINQSNLIKRKKNGKVFG